MAKLKNYTKIGQGILLGIDVTLGGYAYHELLTNFYVGIIVGIFAVVIAIIAFAPEEYRVASVAHTELENSINDLARRIELKANSTSSLLNDPEFRRVLNGLDQALSDLSDDLAKAKKIDTEIGKSGSVINAMETQLKSDPAIYGTIIKMLDKKTLSAADIKALEPLIKVALKVLSSMGVPIKSVDTVLPFVEAILQSPEALSIINNILQTL